MKTPQAKHCFPLTALAVVAGMRNGAAQQPQAADPNTALLSQTASRVRAEALAPNSETDHPMPLVAPWSAGQHGYVFLNDTGANDGQNDEGYSPAWQLSQIAAGHHTLLTLNLPDPTFNQSDPKMTAQRWNQWLNYYKATIQAAAAQKLPIVFVSTQWENLLYNDDIYFALPKEANPNVVTRDAATGAFTVQKKVSPFGPVDSWKDVGRRWATSEMLQQLQAWYPDPPLVLFISNNESPRLRAPEAETDWHYTQAGYANGHSDDYRRLVIGRGWIERYRALQTAWKDNLTAPAWKNNAKFVAYGAFGPGHFGRWAGWKAASQYVDPAAPDVTNPEWHIDPHHKIWDGGAADNYLTSSYTKNTDFQVYSPQIEAMNFEFMRREIMQQAPNYWFELITWNGCDYSPPNKDNATCDGKICTWSPAYTAPRYAGMTQFSMWLLRPRVMRDYRISATKRVDSQPYYDQLVAAVDRVYANSTLQSFWRNSELVANTAHAHPYQALIPAEYQNTQRMYLLSTNHDPAPWNATDQTPGLYTELKVFALARVKGAAGSRQWLVYAFAPKAGADAPLSTTITIPGYRNVTVDATVGGSFYLVSENNGTVQAVS